MKEVISNRRAFTLIELLVVVLIIGILAAIALPQYKLAVEKSRATEAIATVHKMKQNFEEAFLQGNAGDCYGDPDCILADVPVTIINNSVENIADEDIINIGGVSWVIAATGKNYNYAMTPWVGWGIYPNNKTDIEYVFLYVWSGLNGERPTFQCLGLTDFGMKLCTSLCGSAYCNMDTKTAY